MATQPPGTGLTLFNTPAGALPAHIANFFEAEGTNIVPKTTVPSLSPEGKVWTISVDGQKNKMQRRNTDGDLEPLPIMKAVVLDYAKRRGRAYYEGDYDPAKASAPICWSDDGDEPDSSLPGPFTAGTAVEPGASRKISAKCASCPMAVKGSKVTPQGKAVTACAQHLMLAVLPDPAFGLPENLAQPLRLKIAMTSIWDKQSPAQEQQGWLAFDNYVDWLNARGCKHTAAIVTKMKFDPDAAFPKIFFASERPLDAAELEKIKPMLHSEGTKRLLGGTWTPAGADGQPKELQNVATVAQGEPTADVPLVAAAAAPPPKVEETAAVPAGYAMADGEAYTYDQYKASGWTDDVLIANGKLIAQKPAAPPAAEVVTPPPPPQETVVVPAVEEAVVVGEPAAAVVVETTATPAAASPPAAEAVVVAEPAAAPSLSLSAPAAVIVQEPAQADAPAPAPTPQAPEPPAAQAAAAEVTPDVSTDVPADVAGLLAEWK
jgi:hypothetical protein